MKQAATVMEQATEAVARDQDLRLRHGGGAAGKDIPLGYGYGGWPYGREVGRGPSTTRKTLTAGAPIWASAGALEPAGANRPVITGYCRCTSLCAGGSSVIAGALVYVRRQ
jgi:hypothetical protein